jgi:hypothetical protein
MANQLIPATALLAVLDAEPDPAAALAAIRQLLTGTEDPDERRRRLTRERVRRLRERRRNARCVTPSVTPQTTRAIHSVTRVTPHASGPTSPTSDDATDGVTGNALQRYPPHPQAPGPPSGGPGVPARNADRVTDPAGRADQVRFARASAGLRARRRDWSDERCSAAVAAAVDQHDIDEEDGWRALAWLAAQPGTRTPGLLKSALPRALAAIEGSNSRTKSAQRKSSRPGTAPSTRSSPKTAPGPAPTAERSDPWTTRTAARTAVATSTDRPTAAAAPATDHQPADNPHQLALPMAIPGGGQCRPTGGTPDWFRDLVAKRFGRPPDPSRATPTYRPTYRARRTTAA